MEGKVDLYKSTREMEARVPVPDGKPKPCQKGQCEKGSPQSDCVLSGFFDLQLPQISSMGLFLLPDL